MELYNILWKLFFLQPRLSSDPGLGHVTHKKYVSHLKPEECCVIVLVVD